MSLTGRIFIAFLVGLGVPLAFLATLVALDGLHLELRSGSTLALIAGSGAIAVLTAMIFVLRVIRTVQQPLERLVAAEAEIAAGNRSPVLPLEAPGELGRLAQGIERLCARQRGLDRQLDELERRVQGAAGAVETTCAELAQEARRHAENAGRTQSMVVALKDGLAETQLAIEDLLRRLDGQAEITHGLERQLGRVGMNAGKARDELGELQPVPPTSPLGQRTPREELEELKQRLASLGGTLDDHGRLSAEVRGDGLETTGMLQRLENQTARIGEAVTAVISGSDAVNIASTRVLGVTANLADQVARLDEVVSTIGTLAERTKLLSINASIIASEAGEHGRAFAVVAHEIKDLAAATTRAIGEVAGHVESIKDGFQRTVETIEQGQRDIDHDIRLAHDAVVILENVPHEVHQAATLGRSIVLKTEEQLEKNAVLRTLLERVGGQLDQTGERLLTLTAREQRSAAMSEAVQRALGESLAGLQEQTRLVADLGRAMGELRGDGQGVSDLLRQQTITLGRIVTLTEDSMRITERGQRSFAQVASAVARLGRQAGGPPSSPDQPEELSPTAPRSS